MALQCNQLLLKVSDLKVARDFYVVKLGLEIIENHPRMFAIRAGDVRFSISEGSKPKEESDEDSAVTIMLRTSDLDHAVAELNSRGVEFDGEIHTAPGFMRSISLRDPDRNQLYLTEYLRDPLMPV